MSLANLPGELVSTILEKCDQNALLTLIQCSTSWYNLVVPFLYENPEVEIVNVRIETYGETRHWTHRKNYDASPRLYKLVRRLLHKPCLALYVRSVKPKPRKLFANFYSKYSPTLAGNETCLQIEPYLASHQIVPDALHQTPWYPSDLVVVHKNPERFTDAREVFQSLLPLDAINDKLQKLIRHVCFDAVTSFRDEWLREACFSYEAESLLSCLYLISSRIQTLDLGFTFGHPHFLHTLRFLVNQTKSLDKPSFHNLRSVCQNAKENPHTGFTPYMILLLLSIPSLESIQGRPVRCHFWNTDLRQTLRLEPASSNVRRIKLEGLTSDHVLSSKLKDVVQACRSLATFSARWEDLRLGRKYSTLPKIYSALQLMTESLKELSLTYDCVTRWDRVIHDDNLEYLDMESSMPTLCHLPKLSRVSLGLIFMVGGKADIWYGAEYRYEARRQRPFADADRFAPHARILATILPHNIECLTVVKSKEERLAPALMSLENVAMHAQEKFPHLKVINLRGSDNADRNCHQSFHLADRLEDVGPYETIESFLEIREFVRELGLEFTWKYSMEVRESNNAGQLLEEMLEYCRARRNGEVLNDKNFRGGECIPCTFDKYLEALDEASGREDP